MSITTSFGPTPFNNMASSRSSMVQGQDEGNDHKKKSMADYETFVKLLVAQMKNQDPSAPADPTQYVAQLASFSSVEQSIQTNTKLEAANAKLESLLSSQPMMQASNYVGKNLSNADGSINGIVQSVTIYGDGLVATLENGKELVIEAGVKVSQAIDHAKAIPSSTPSTKPDTTDEVKQA